MTFRRLVGMTGAAACLILAACSGGGHALHAAPSEGSTTSSEPIASTAVATTSARVTTTRATAPSPGPCCGTTPTGPLTASFSGLSAGQRVPNNGQLIAFAVTWTNNSQTSYPAVAPVVAGEHYDGGTGPNREVHGSLQRLNARTGAWQDVSFAEGEGTDFMYTGDDAAFALPVGSAVTIHYRLSLTKDDNPGTLGIDAVAVQPRDHTMLGSLAVDVAVVSH